MKNDKEFGIVANVIADRSFRKGAKVIILRMSFPEVYAYGMHKSGKIITKWIKMKRLENYRPAWQPIHIQENKWFFDKYATKEEAKKEADKLNQIFKNMRAFSPNGKEMIKEGLSENQAVRKFLHNEAE